MPRKIDPAVRERCVRQVLEHLPEYPSLPAAAEVVVHDARGPSAPSNCIKLKVKGLLPE